MSGPQQNDGAGLVAEPNGGTTAEEASPTGANNADRYLTKMLSEEERVRSSTSADQQQQAEEEGARRTRPAQQGAKSSGTAPNTAAAMTIWRERVSQWCYRVIDHVGAHRSVAYNVMHLLDAYMAATGSAAVLDATSYQIVAMSALYLVLRLREPTSRLTVGQMVAMSRGDGVVTPDRIARTMKTIVHTLSASWRDLCFAPSPGDFVVAYVGQLMAAAEETQESTAVDSSSPSGIQDLLQASRWSSILDDATYLAELSVCDTYLRTERPSVVAYAAVLNVLSDNIELKKNLQMLQSSAGNASTLATVRSIHARIRFVHSQSSDYVASEDAPSSTREASTTPTIIPQDAGDAEEQQQQQGTTVAVSEAPPSTTAPTKRGRGISAVVSYDDVSEVIGRALESPPSSDSEDDDVSSPTTATGGMKRVQNFSSLVDQNKRARVTTPTGGGTASSSCQPISEEEQQ